MEGKKKHDLGPGPGIEESQEARETREKIVSLFDKLKRDEVTAREADDTLTNLLRTGMHHLSEGLRWLAPPRAPGNDDDALPLVNSSFSWILQVSEYLKAGDTIYDLGCGVGHVALPLALRHQDCRVVGIERHPGRVRYAREQAQRLGVDNCSFICGSADEEDLSRGTFFYLYHPFDGQTLERVLRRISSLAGTRTFFVTPFDLAPHLRDYFPIQQEKQTQGTAPDKIYYLETGRV